ncbi:MAG: 4-hydroxy-tetrahydrodipicolinate reductase [Candidatus Hermodarchaeota archaeon]
MIKLLILGPTGNTSRLIAKLAFEDDEIEVVAACDISHIDEELGFIIGVNDPNKIRITDIKDLQKVINETRPDVAVDFTVAKATEINCIKCVENGIRCVIGTTALSNDFFIKMEGHIKRYNAPAVISSNMATGVNVLFKMVSILTNYLSDWDIEVLEAHHHRKLDSPSGTAFTLARNISNSLGVKIEDVAKFGRGKGPNKRQIGAKNEIGIHSIRAGDIVGDHTILYAGSGERIELKHQAHSRNCFASGAITAIKFIMNAIERKIYTTYEVLGL